MTGRRPKRPQIFRPDGANSITNMRTSAQNPVKDLLNLSSIKRGGMMAYFLEKGSSPADGIHKTGTEREAAPHSAGNGRWPPGRRPRNGFGRGPAALSFSSLPLGEKRDMFIRALTTAFMGGREKSGGERRTKRRGV